MKSIIEWFARNGVAANLLMVAILALGVYAAVYKIVLREFPDFPLRRVVVAVPYRGSTPTEVEKAILTRIEEAIYSVQGIKEIESRASSNSGTVSIEIEDGYDLGKTLDEIKNLIDAIPNFPVDAERPQVSLADYQERVITVVLAAEMSEMHLKRLGERLRDEIMSLPNISLASLQAVRPYEIGLEVSEITLKQYGLTFDSVVQAIRNSSIDLSAGRIMAEGGSILLRTNEQAYTTEEFSRIVVLTREDGTRITVGDIASVTDGFDETPIVARFNGRRAIGINVYRSGNQDAIEIGQSVRNYISGIRETLPSRVVIDYWDDDSERIQQRLLTLKGSATFGFILVMLVLALFLRPMLAFWVAWGIPIAFSGAFMLLPLLGVSLNLITLFSFILVLGIVVDDAIVTGENVFQHMQRGEDSLTASIRGTQEVAIPVTFGILTTMVAFYPLAAMTGIRGTFFKQIPIVVIPVLIFSLVESKLILPAHLKHCKNLREGTTKLNALIRFQRLFANGLENFVDKIYRPTLHFCLNHRYATLATFLAILIVFICLILSGRIAWRNFPRIPRDTVSISLTMPPGTTFETTYGHIERIESEALSLEKELEEEHGRKIIKNIFAATGGHPFQGRSRSRNNAGVAERGEVIVEMIPTEQSGINYGSMQLTMALRNRVPPIPEAEQLSFSFGWRSGSALSFTLIGPNVEDLKTASNELQKKLATYNGLYDIEDSFDRATDEFELKLKREAEHLGVTAAQLARQVRQAFFGSEAQRIQRGRDDVRVMVRYPEKQRKSIASLHTMMIRTGNGTEVPFETVAEIVPGKSPPSILRVDRKRVIEVRADADEDEVDVETIQTEIEENYLPELFERYPGLEYGLRGRAREVRDNFVEFQRGIIFVLVLIYVLLAIPFKSYSQPLIIMSVIPFGVVGSILGHVIMSLFPSQNHVISMMSVLGMLALSGVVVNDSLVLVDFVNRQRREGMSLPEAVRLAGARRFRPVILTSLTTFVGLMPLMFEDSRQAQFMVPMGISLGWGVLFATFITLILVPTVALIFNDIGIAFRKLYGLPLAEGSVELRTPEKVREENTVLEGHDGTD